MREGVSSIRFVSRFTGSIRQATPGHPARVIAAILGGIFLWAAFWKSVDPSSTEAAFTYMLGDAGPVAPATHALIYAEILLGAALIAGVALRWSLLAAGAVLTIFTGWLVHLAASGVALDCGCALSRDTDAAGVGWFEVGRTAALTVGAAIGVVMSGSSSVSDGQGRLQNPCDGDIAA